MLLALWGSIFYDARQPPYYTGPAYITATICNGWHSEYTFVEVSEVGAPKQPLIRSLEELALSNKSKYHYLDVNEEGFA